MMKKSTYYSKSFSQINSWIFITFLFIIGILFWVFPKKTISVYEKRRLSGLPTFSISKFLNSEFSDSMDLYYSDNFIYRDELINMANLIKEKKGYISKDFQIFETPVNNSESKKQNVSEAISTNDDTPEDIPYENFKSVIIAKKRAIQMFAGSPYAAANYAKMLSFYKQELHDSIRIYLMAIPVGGDFYLPAGINKKSEIKFIDTLYKLMQPDIICVNAYDYLRKNKHQYIQFNTDHHWTGLGAYYAYLAYCASSSQKPVYLNQMSRKVIPNFLGTLYYHTRANVLKENIDSVEYFKIPFETQAYFFKKGIINGYETSLYAEYAKGTNAYGVFLGADYPLMRIKSTVKNKRKVVVFKDSYGNAFSPYLASHFEEVFVVDYRYFEGNIKELIKTYGITDLFFAHNVYVLNSDYAIKRETSFLKSKITSTK